MQKNISQAAADAYDIKCVPALHADYGIDLVSKIHECYDRVWVHERSSIPASMAVALVRVLTPHWENVPEYQLTFMNLLLTEDLDAVASIVKKGLSARRALQASIKATPINVVSEEEFRETAGVLCQRGATGRGPKHQVPRTQSHV